MGAHRRSSRSFRGTSVLAAVLLTGAGLVWGIAPVQAASPCPVPGGFEIDGDMTQLTCTPSGDDWNTPGIGVQSTSQGGTYKTAGKDDGVTSGWESSGSTPDKTNFEQAYATSRVVAGHFYVYVAWERSSSAGTQGYAIEIDNSGANVGNDGTPQPNRANGGSVFYISSQGSAAPTFDSACSFSSQSNYGDTCTSSDSSITAAINTVTMSDPLRGSSQPAGTFFEAALDITALTGIVPSCPGASAASVYLRSITGQTSNGNLKGYMAPLTVAPASTCVAPPITTASSPGGSLNAVGSTQHDEVTVGTAQEPGVGSVAFYLCQPGTVSNNNGNCSDGGSLVSTNALDGDGQASSANVSGASTTSLGKYCWRAEFTPGANDHNYLPGTHTNSTTECFTVVHASPAISTQIAVTGANAPGLGFTTLGDTANLTGFVGSVTGETVTFTLHGPYVGAVPNGCKNDPVAFSTTGALTAGGVATTSATYQPSQAGIYVWIASYPGNALNDPAEGACSDTNESSTIVAAQIDVAKSANPPGPVSAGTAIGFDLTVSNAGSVPATGVHVTDNLPSGANAVPGGDLNWSLSPAYTGCAITGAVGSQVLNCDLGTVASGSLPAIHVVANTSPSDCGTVQNKATISTTNGSGTDSDVATVSVLCPHLTISKDADAASVSVGSPIGFTITASNNGQGTASGVLINDTLPTGPGIVWSIDGPGTTGPLSCSITAGVLSCTGSLDAGATQVVHITSPTQWTGTGDGVVNSCLGGPNSNGVYVNSAQISATNVTDSPSDGAQEQVLCPNLQVTKTADADAVNAGTAIGFTVTAHNGGSGNATGVLVNDPLPAGATWSIDANGTSGPLTCGITNGTLSCTGALAAGATETVHITAPTSFSQCAQYDNTATLTATNTPQAPTASDSTSVLCADVVVQKSADAVAVDVGEDIGFTVTVQNNGDGEATGVHTSDPLPAGEGVDWAIDSSSGPLTCSITGTAPTQTLKCDGDLAASGDEGDGQTVHITSSTIWNADNNSCGDYENTATLTWDNGPDVTISSNTVTESVLCPVLGFTKVPDAAAVSAGDPIGFTVELTNSGPGTAKGVEIHDPLPAPDGSDVLWGDLVVTGAAENACAITGAQGAQQLDCTLGDISSEADVTIHISAATSPQSCGAYDNTATLTSTNVPGTDASASTAVQCAAPAFTKTADNDVVDAGQQIGFTITASNSDAPGTGTAKGVVINDPLPSGDGIDWSIVDAPAGCMIDGAPPTQVVQCPAADLAPGASAVVHVISATTNDSCGTYPNTAQFTATNTDGLTGEAETNVTACVAPPVPPVVSPPTPTPSPLPDTGNPVSPAMLWTAYELLLFGAVLTYFGRRRKSPQLA